MTTIFKKYKICTLINLSISQIANSTIDDAILEKIQSKHKYLSNKSELTAVIKSIAYKVNIILGAGDIGKEVEHIKNELEYAN